MAFTQSGTFSTDADGFGIPRFGGALACRQGLVEYTDTSAKTLFTLPANSVPVWVTIDVTEDFDDTAGDTLDIGAAADGDYFANDVDIATAVTVSTGATGFIVGRTGTQLDEPTAITATYTGTDGDASQGAAVITVWYFIQEDGYTVS